MRHINYIYQNPLSRLRPTEHLYDELEHLHMNQAVLRAGDRVYREVTRAIKALRGTLRKLERVNEPIKTKWEMLLDPFRRDKVLHELGGKDALLRWEARRKRFWVFGRRRKVRKDEHEHIDMRDTPKTLSRIPGRSGIKTDSTGRFCLAPAIEPLVYASHAETRVRGDAPVTPRSRPRIALTPEELRGDVLVGLGVETETANMCPRPRERGRYPERFGKTRRAEGAAVYPGIGYLHLSAAARSCAHVVCPANNEAVEDKNKQPP